MRRPRWGDSHFQNVRVFELDPKAHSFCPQTEAFKSALLVCACQRRRPAVIRALLHGHNASYEGFGVVHHAVGRHQCWDDQAQNAIIEILELLIGLGVSVEKLALEEEDGHGRRVLHYCAMSNKYLVAKFILELNPALSLEMADITDRNGKTALFHISELPRPDEHLVKLLVSKNATFGKKRPPPAISHGQVLAREWCRLAISKRRGSTSWAATGMAGLSLMRTLSNVFHPLRGGLVPPGSLDFVIISSRVTVRAFDDRELAAQTLRSRPAALAITQTGYHSGA